MVSEGLKYLQMTGKFTQRIFRQETIINYPQNSIFCTAQRINPNWLLAKPEIKVTKMLVVLIHNKMSGSEVECGIDTKIG